MDNILSNNEQIILDLIQQNPLLSSKEIHEKLPVLISYATTKRILQQLIKANYLQNIGKGRATTYQISPVFELLKPIDINSYFKKEIDDREIKQQFNFSLIPDVLSKVSVFTTVEMEHLLLLQAKYKNNIDTLSATGIKKEMERLAIDLSWKSSQIEGNTYSLLETELLLKEKHTAAGKTKEEAIMLLNHKEAIDFIVAHPDFIEPLSTTTIENIHSILMKELGVDRNIRTYRVGISGTNYKPIDNEYQLKEAVEEMCMAINTTANVFTKALLALALISYIQPFADGNKRTARIISNALLIQHLHCPISFRTANPADYKKAMLLFYEQNNISAIKSIFISQFEFAVGNYF